MIPIYRTETLADLPMSPGAASGIPASILPENEMWLVWIAGRPWGTELQREVRTGAEQSELGRRFWALGEDGGGGRLWELRRGGGERSGVSRVGAHLVGLCWVHVCAQTPSRVQEHNGEDTQAGALPAR